MFWLPILEYSIKHKVSISTLRRRIKAKNIEFLFEDGKYLVLDEPLPEVQRLHRPSQRKANFSKPSVNSAKPELQQEFSEPLIKSRPVEIPKKTDKSIAEKRPLDQLLEQQSNVVHSSTIPSDKRPIQEQDFSLAKKIQSEGNFSQAAFYQDADSVLKPAFTREVYNRIIFDLKKAYATILAEKDDQILKLKEEVSNLKTLVRILEAEGKD